MLYFRSPQSRTGAGISIKVRAMKGRKAKRQKIRTHKYKKLRRRMRHKKK
jgi:hypothetical protein